MNYPSRRLRPPSRGRIRKSDRPLDVQPKAIQTGILMPGHEPQLRLDLPIPRMGFVFSGVGGVAALPGFVCRMGGVRIYIPGVCLIPSGCRIRGGIGIYWRLARVIICHFRLLHGGRDSLRRPGSFRTRFVPMYPRRQATERYRLQSGSGHSGAADDFPQRRYLVSVPQF